MKKLKYYFKEYIDEFGILLLGGVLGYFALQMINNGYRSPVAWSIIETMFDSLWPLIMGMFGLMIKRKFKKQEKKIDQVLDQTDRRESEIGIDLGRRGDDWS